jgi:mannosyl-3-phosphoglycerate phosphatase family protein
VPSHAPILVFSDLDATLLDPRRHSNVDEVTREALARVVRERVPIVLSSMRTRAEVEAIQQELGITHPFICENGAAVFIPNGYFGFDIPHARDIAGYKAVEFGRPYTEVVRRLHHAAGRLGVEIVGFGDMSVEDVAVDCGLPLLQARLAKLREYTEPFRIRREGADVNRLVNALRAAGLTCSNRGRYYHAGTVRCDLGAQLLCGWYRRAFGHMMTVVFGDHVSTAPLLRQADVPLIVDDHSDATARLLIEVPTARVTTADSVSAWADVIADLAEAAQYRGRPCSH